VKIRFGEGRTSFLKSPSNLPAENLGKVLNSSPVGKDMLDH